MQCTVIILVRQLEYMMWIMLFLLLEGHHQILGKAHLNQRQKPSTTPYSTQPGDEDYPGYPELT